MATQTGMDFGDADEANKEGIAKAAAKKAEKEEAIKQTKEKAKQAEADYFRDQRTPKSPLIARAELDKMKTITGGQSSMISPGGNTTAAGRGGSGSGSMGTGKMNRDITKNYKKGGTASSRADGCCVKGKTKGKMV